MDRCCLCNEIINPPVQNMASKYGWVCDSCVAKGYWEKLDANKNRLDNHPTIEQIEEIFSDYKIVNNLYSKLNNKNEKNSK